MTRHAPAVQVHTRRGGGIPPASVLRVPAILISSTRAGPHLQHLRERKQVHVPAEERRVREQWLAIAPPHVPRVDRSHPCKRAHFVHARTPRKCEGGERTAVVADDALGACKEAQLVEEALAPRVHPQQRTMGAAEFPAQPLVAAPLPQPKATAGGTSRRGEASVSAHLSRRLSCR